MFDMVSPSTWLASSRFHKSFSLPADPNSNRPRSLRVTYSDIGYGSNNTPYTALRDSEPAVKAVVVFIGGLMGGRYTILSQHDFCVQNKIRILTVDRPGFGGSDPVPLAERITTWLATFPALLAYLKIPHVAISCHSGGAIYAMNTLLHHRQLLHPTRPYVSFLAPFVYPSESGTMKPLLWLPSAGVAHMHDLVKVVHNYVIPIVGWSKGGSFASDVMAQKATHNEEEILSDDNLQKDAEWRKEAEKLTVKYLVSEDISGSSHEAMLLLRKSKDTQKWGLNDWTDYSEATKLIIEQEATMQVGNDSASRPLDISVFHAATDRLNGPGGATYFDRCWSDALSAVSVDGSLATFSSQHCEGTDHDGVVDPLKGPLRKWLLRLVEDVQESESA